MHGPLDPEIETKRRPPFGEFVALVAFMMGLTAFAVDNVLPAFPELGRTFSVSDPNSLQLLVYVYMIGFGATHLVYGPASDILGRRPVFLAGLAVFLVGCVAAMLAPTSRRCWRPAASRVAGRRPAGSSRSRSCGTASRDAKWRASCRSP
jgi:DHA1 family bicyclomycin/chloramphenicol resistance-like MFS transporter